MEQQDQNNNNVLNLDEMLGTKKLIVKIQGKEYPLRTVKSLSPEEFGLMAKYGVSLSSLTDDDINLNNGAAAQELVDKVIQIIAPELPRYKPSWKEMFSRGYKRHFDVSLQEASAILEFWSKHNRSKKAVTVAPKTKKNRR